MPQSWEEEHLRSTVCFFTKHRNQSWWDVVQQDRDYVEWVILNIDDLDDELYDALKWGVRNVPDRL